MNIQFIEYPKCSTCRNARKWLDEHGVCYDDRSIVERTPTENELELWIGRSGLPLKSFFNTSGLLYKSLQLKDKLPGMTPREQIALLASDGMLIKRPLLVSGSRVCVGFKPEEWEALLK